MTQSLWDMTLAAARESHLKGVDQTAAIIREHLVRWIDDECKKACLWCQKEMPVERATDGWYHDMAVCMASRIRSLLHP